MVLRGIKNLLQQERKECRLHDPGFFSNKNSEVTTYKSNNDTMVAHIKNKSCFTISGREDVSLEGKKTCPLFQQFIWEDLRIFQQIFWDVIGFRGPNGPVWGQSEVRLFSFQNNAKTEMVISIPDCSCFGQRGLVLCPSFPSQHTHWHLGFFLGVSSI